MKVRVASAGTGKTTSLIKRYLELLSQGFPLRRIAGVTFTRVAADELRQRVDQGVREVLATGKFLDYPFDIAKEILEEAKLELNGAVITTIHGFMIETLRLTAPQLGLDPDFTVIGEWQAEAIFEEELSSLIYLAKDNQHSLHASVALFGDKLRKLLLHLFKERSQSEKYLATDITEQALLGLFLNVYERYRVRLGAKILPPAEIERRALELIRHPKAIARVSSRFLTVLVDEFQDVNPLQGKFFEALEKQGVNIEVVGDPKQSIYGFRNADVEVFRRALSQSKIRGELQTSLTQSRRHSKVLIRFLNNLTASFAQAEMGFGKGEVATIESVGTQASKKGYLEIHWVIGKQGIADLRQYEARILTNRIKNLLKQKAYSHNDIAVLARSYDGLQIMEKTLTALGLPCILLQGRGYYERLEIRDLYHALQIGINPSGLSLGAFLRSPFAQLSLTEIDYVLQAAQPLQVLNKDFPQVAKRIKQISQQVRTTPLQALKFLVRDLNIAGKHYVDFIDERARENVDALLFTVAEQPPSEIELLLDRLTLLSRQRDAGDVPQSGEGISLLTVHRAKGLEWPVVAVFDLGRSVYHHPQDIFIAETGKITLKENKIFAEIRDIKHDKAEKENYRLFYVAASRAKDVLILSGSIKDGKPQGWAAAMQHLKLGTDIKPYNNASFMHKTWPYQAIKTTQKSKILQVGATSAPTWLNNKFPLLKFPPVTSPSRLKSAEDFEPLPFIDSEEGERLPGKARAIGTLVHYAISQNWQADNPLHMDNLKYQEVMFPFEVAEQEELLAEVKELLINYQNLLGQELPSLAKRNEDYPELPMVLPQGDTVWQGIIDRFYCVDDQWYLEDYKTDQEIKPEKYHFQLAVYLKAIQAVRDVQPEVQLVYLRFNKVIKVEVGVLEQAFELVGK